MVAGRSSEPLATAAVKSDAVQVRSNRAVLRSGKVNPAAIFVHVMQFPDFPRAARDLPDKLAALVVQVQIPPSGALALKQEAPVAQEMKLAGIIDPGLRRLAEQLGRRAPADRCHAYIQPGLRPVLHVEEDLLPILGPASAGNKYG